jgi:hypothetical protein
MAYFDIRALKEFYARISAERGLGVLEFQSELTDLFLQPRSIADVNDFRLSKGAWKKLADEVVPVSRFLRIKDVQTGRIRFPLDSNPPDSWLWTEHPPNRVGIEVTIAKGTERFYLAKELVEKGIGRGFVGLPDDAPRVAFRAEMSKDRVMYTSGEVLSADKQGVLRCLSQKNARKFSGFLLLIQAHLLPLPRERWQTISGDLQAAAAECPFAEVHVIGDIDERLHGFQIK